MRSLVLFLISAICVPVVQASAESEIATQMKVQRQMNERYSLTALCTLLRKTVEESPRFGEVDLSRAVISSDWAVIRMDPPIKIRGGSWVLWDRTPDKAKFILAYTLADGRSIDLLVRRKSRDRFALVSLSFGTHATSDDESLPEIDLTQPKSPQTRASQLSVPTPSQP